MAVEFLSKANGDGSRNLLPSLGLSPNTENALNTGDEATLCNDDVGCVTGITSESTRAFVFDSLLSFWSFLFSRASRAASKNLFWG
jgi:hypothetical protein